MYENGAKIAEFSSVEDEKADKFLICKFSEILKTYKIKELVYANTPGSFMGMKVSYVILRTLSIALDVPLYAISGFELSGFGPIRANKNFSYVYDRGEIKMKKCVPAVLSLPQDLSVLNKSDDILPNYSIEAV